MKNLSKIIPISMLALAFPFAAHAQNITSLVDSVAELINSAVPLLIGVAVVFFLYGLARFILSAGEPDARKRGQSLMIWGILAIVVMVSVWGLVNFVVQSTGLDNDLVPAPATPVVPGT